MIFAVEKSLFQLVVLIIWIWVSVSAIYFVGELRN